MSIKRKICGCYPPQPNITSQHFKFPKEVKKIVWTVQFDNFLIPAPHHSTYVANHRTRTLSTNPSNFSIRNVEIG